MHKHLSNIGLGGVTVVAVMGLLSLVGGLITDYNLNSVNSIVFTTQQSRPLTTASAQARLNQRKQANSNFVTTVVTQASSALGVTTSNPGVNSPGSYQNNPVCTPNCDDGNDNDNDNYIDQKDRTCYDLPNGGGLFHNDRDESMGNCTPSTPPLSKYSCNNYQCVVDPNGTMDLPTCQSACTPPPPPGGGTVISTACDVTCDDGLDNDGDKLIDILDPECIMPNIGYMPFLSESMGGQCLSYVCATDCDDMLDNDGDQLVDAGDNECLDTNGSHNKMFNEMFGGVCYNRKMSKQPPSTPSCTSNCNDLADNDGDNYVDTDDFNCYEIVNNTKVYHPEYDEKRGVCGKSGTGGTPPPTPPSKYSCNNYQCVVDHNGTMDLSTCQSTCTPPPPPPPSQCGQQTSPICDSYTDPLRKGECNNLMWLYTCTDGPNWTDKTSWNTSTDYCSWKGITCTNNKVTEISLYDNQLNGNIPNFDKLQNLQNLDLSSNLLSGSIPDFDLPNLQGLNLSSNILSGPIPNFNLPNLEILELINNQLNGVIPNFNKLSKLKRLYLGYNNGFHGPIPNFNLPNLEYLGLSNDELSGPIPNFNLPNLEHLYIEYNRLNGPIPNFNLPNLRSLWINNNELSGPIPNFNLPNLKGLGLSDNQLEGNPQSIIKLLNLEVLCIGSNKFTGLGDANSGWLKDYQTIKNITYCTLLDNLVQR